MLKFKILISSLSLAFIGLQATYAQLPEKELVTADSLYESKQYIGAIKIYENIFDAGKSSPGMLLKMARIQEGMGNVGESMFYLENYYRQTKDEKSLQYLIKIAEKNQAAGFDYSFPFQAELTYQDWKPQILLFLTLCASLGLTLMLMKKNKKRYFAIVLIPILCIAFINNYSLGHQAIITEQPSFLLEGPSSGANLIEKVTTPTKILVKDQVDIWSEVIYNDNPAYIRSRNIKRF